MILPARYRQWLSICCCSLLLASCAKHEATQIAAETTAANVFARSLEPTRPEPVNRIFNRSCRACHGPDGHGIAAVAPDLRRAQPRSFEQWQQYLSDPQAGHPGTQMPPPTWINTDEIAVMANYLIRLTQPASAMIEEQAAEQAPASIEPTGAAR